MSDILPTVTIKTENGPVIINKSDYNPDLHELHEGDVLAAGEGGANTGNTDTPGDTPKPKKLTKAQQAAADKAAAEAAANRQFGVSDNDGKFVVLDLANGEAVTDVEGIDANGYPDSAAAWAAIMAVKSA